MYASLIIPIFTRIRRAVAQACAEVSNLSAIHVDPCHRLSSDRQFPCVPDMLLPRRADIKCLQAISA